MKNRKNYIVTIWAVLFSQGIAFSQQTPLFPAYNYNPFIINPAYAGMTPGSVVSLSHDRHTRKVEGTPTSSSLSFQSPLSNGRMGLGAAVIDDRIGVTSATTATVVYSYQLLFDLKPGRHVWGDYDKHVFSFGMTAGIQRLHENLLELGTADDPVFAENLSETIPVIGAGILYNKVGYYVGVSVPNLLGGKLASRHHVEVVVPVYAYLGYRFFADFYKEIMVTPNALVKYEKGAPLQVDVNLSANLRNRFEIGAGYRSSSSLNLLVGFYAVEQLRFVYHYTVGFRRPTLGNNHGIALSYAFGYN